MNKEYSNKYKNEWQNQISKIINNNTYIGITLETFKKFYENSDKQTLISTVIQKIYKAINISLLDDASWDNYVNNINNIKKIISSSPVSVKQLSTSFKENCSIRNKYKGKITYKTNNVVDLSLVFDDMIFELAEKQTQIKQAQSEAGKKGKTVVIEGIEYKSISDAAKQLNMSRKAIYHKIDKKIG